VTKVNGIDIGPKGSSKITQARGRLQGCVDFDFVDQYLQRHVGGWKRGRGAQSGEVVPVRRRLRDKRTNDKQKRARERP
jgi:hypothetical protein